MKWQSALIIFSLLSANLRAEVIPVSIKDPDPAAKFLQYLKANEEVFLFTRKDAEDAIAGCSETERYKNLALDLPDTGPSNTLKLIATAISFGILGTLTGFILQDAID